MPAVQAHLPFPGGAGHLPRAMMPIPFPGPYVGMPPPWPPPTFLNGLAPPHMPGQRRQAPYPICRSASVLASQSRRCLAQIRLKWKQTFKTTISLGISLHPAFALGLLGQGAVLHLIVSLALNGIALLCRSAQSAARAFCWHVPATAAPGRTAVHATLPNSCRCRPGNLNQ